MAGIGDIAKAAGVKYEAVSATIEGIRSLLMQGEKITLQDFGTFYIDVQDKKVARKVATSEKIDVPEKSVPKFRFNYTFKAKVAEKVKVDKEKLQKKRERKAKYDAKMAEKAGTKAPTGKKSK
ncbi:MAG: Bacterial DNA-binding protein [Sedimentibacter sp.]|jgi:nucleoid DNA-binding protein|nr:Bacterial DNA-binding protein [Sedimentibacter sp.]